MEDLTDWLINREESIEYGGSMKLGNGKNKYKIKFKYSKTGRIATKNVYADDLMEARILFNKEYKDYQIEIIDWSWEG